MNTQNFYACEIIYKTKEGDVKAYCDFCPKLEITKFYGKGPYFKIKIRKLLENKKEDNIYWGWKDYKKSLGIYLNLKGL